MPITIEVIEPEILYYKTIQLLCGKIDVESIIVRGKYKNYEYVVNRIDREIMFFNQQGEFDRDDGPAYLTPTQYKYIRHNQRHNTKGPAIVTTAHILYYIYNELHNENGPAIITKNLVVWCRHNKPYIPPDINVESKTELIRRFLKNDEPVNINEMKKFFGIPNTFYEIKFVR